MAQLAGSLAHRQQLIAWMLAVGRKPREIAEALAVSEKIVERAMASPLCQDLIRQAQAEIKERLLADVIEKLAAEAMPTLRRLVELRDQGRDLKVALGASRELFARHVPAKTQVEEERTFKILFAHDVEPLLEAIAEQHGRPYVRPARAIPADVDTEGADFVDDDSEDEAAEALARLAERMEPTVPPRRRRVIPADTPLDPGPYERFDSEID
jgi:hypothetical protein